MEAKVTQVFDRLGNRWLVPPAVLRDVYSLMVNDMRFHSTKGSGGIRYKRMEKHLHETYRITEVSERQLRYLVKEIKRRKKLG